MNGELKYAYFGTMQEWKQTLGDTFIFVDDLKLYAATIAKMEIFNILTPLSMIYV